MKTDKTTKALLALIAIALFTIAFDPWLRPQSVGAQAQTPFQCTGDLKGSFQNPLDTKGQPPNGYSVQITCR
jgi:hypothetical protein